MIQRAELLNIVEKKDLGLLVQLLKDVRAQDLTETLAECSQRNQECMWESLRGVCTEVLLDNEVDEDQEKEKKKRAEQYAFLDGLVTLATATISQKNVVLPVPLMDTALLLHGVLLTLPDEIEATKYRLAQLFEEWWRRGLDGCEDIIANTLVYLLRHSLAKGTATDIKAVWRIHTVLPLINFEVPSATDLKNLLGRCCSSAQYLKTDEGRRFLSYVMTLNPGLVDWMHGAIKNMMPFAPTSWLPLYGAVYFKAWQRSSGDILQKIENDCIQNLMNHAIHASRQGPQRMSTILFRVMHYIHGQKKQRGVDSMLLKLYNPILWRSLSVPNTDVRVNSAALLLDAFPLQDPSDTAEDTDTLVQKQFDIMQRLLADPCPEVRALTAEGMCRILGEYLEMIPGEVVQTLLCKLIKELAWDTSSPAVRVAVIKGVTLMLDTPVCHLLLKPLLPALSMCLHDKAETVRIAMMDLLLSVRKIRTIKYWSICPVEHLLSRLETDSQSVVRRVVELLFPSFLPLDQSPQEQVSRCVTLIESNTAAARLFFLNAPCHLTLSDTVKYISLLCRYVLESVRTMAQLLDTSEMDSSSADSKGRRNKRSKDGNLQGEASKEDDNESSKDEADDILSQEILQGLLEAMFLMWTAVAKQLDLAENEDLKQSIMKKLSVTLPEVLKVSQDPQILSVVEEIAGHLPPKAVPTISRGSLSKLRNMAEGSKEEDYVELLEATCLWKMAPQVLQLISDWLEESLTPQLPADTPKSARKPEKTKKKCVKISVPDDKKRPQLALDYLTAMLKSVVCRRILLDDHHALLVTMNRLLSRVMASIEMHLEGESANGATSVSFLESIFCLHLRLSVLLHQPEDRDWDGVAHMKEILAWGEERLLPLLRGPSATKDKTGKKTAGVDSKADLAKACVMVTLNICSNMLMLGMGDRELMEQIITFCQAALNQVDILLVVERVLSCLYQLLLFDELDAASAVVKCMSHALVAVNTCLSHQHLHDPKVLKSVKSLLSGVTTAVLNHRPAGDKDDAAIVTELTSTMLAAVLAELTHASKKDILAASAEEKQEDVASISTCIITCLTRSVPGRRCLIQEAENCIESGALSDVHAVHAMVHLILILHSKESYKKDVDLGPVHAAVSAMVQRISSQPPDPEHTDPDVFRDVMESVQTKLQTFAGKTS